MREQTSSRRRFLKLGLAGSAALATADLTRGAEAADGEPLPQGIDLEKWKKLKAAPYAEGSVPMPGVCQLPGPLAKRNWPDRSKYEDVEKVPGMCQLCSTICGIVGYVKEGRLIKIEGNPNDPNSRGHLCARGHAGLNHQYHPERLLYPLRRVGKRGEGKWKRISWDEALDEIAANLKKVRQSGHPGGVCLSSGSAAEQGCHQAIFGCLWNQHAVESSFALLGQSQGGEFNHAVGE